MAANKPEQPDRKPHALVVPWSAQGHLNPMMHLSKKLAARGVIITFVNTQANHNRLIPSRENSDQSQRGLGSNLPTDMIRLVAIPDHVRSHTDDEEHHVANDHQSDLHKQVEATAQCMILMEASLMELAQKVEPPVTCIIAGVFVPSPLNVARKLGVPLVSFWTQSAASYAAHIVFTQGKEILKPPYGDINGKIDDQIVTCVPGCPPLKFKEIPTFLQPCDSSDFLFWFSTLCFQQLHESTFILLNTYDALEEASLKFIAKENANMCSIGPALPSEFFSIDDQKANEQFKKKQSKINATITSLWPEDYGCLEWLDRQQPSSVLYVSFGSVAFLSAQQIEEFAMGLEESQCPILMVVRPNMMYGASAVFPQGFADRMKERAMFVEWAPQLHVLSHAGVGGFLTHCGWNSTLESVSRGVPMLCWPCFSDQMMDCRCIVDGWRIGLEFEADDVKQGLVSRETVEKKVSILMDPHKSKGMRERIAKLRDAARTAMMEEGSSHKNLELLVNFLTATPDSGVTNINV